MAFERYTDRSRKVMQLATRAATTRSQPAVTPLYILAGIIEEGSGVAVNVLKNLDVWEAVRSSVQKQLPPFSIVTVFDRNLPLDADSLKVHELCLEFMGLMGGNPYVGTEAQLMALAKLHPELFGGQITYEQIRAETFSLLGWKDPLTPAGG
jgi:ATP-dependent Clp protease ATP-binding subunit ClpC